MEDTYDEKNGKKKYKVLILFLGCIIGLVILVWYSFVQARKVADQFLAALRDYDLELAYDYTALSYREDTDLEKFEDFVLSYPILESQVSSQLGLRGYIFGRIALGGSLVDARGATVPVEFVLLTENRMWRIYSIELGISSKSFDLPDEEIILLERTIRERGIGYIMDYPQDWRMTMSEDFVATFEPAFGSNAEEGVVVVQNIEAGSAEQVEQDLIDQYSQISSLTAYHDQKEYIYTMDGEVDLIGRQLIIEYPQDGQEWRGWFIILPRRGQELVHVWSYANTIGEYRDHLPLAEAILASWEIGQEIGQDID